MYQNKILSKNKNNRISDTTFEVLDGGSLDMIRFISLDDEECYKNLAKLSGYPNKREIAISNNSKKN